MKKALFLDRDGVINVDTGYVYKKEDFCFVDGIFDLCHRAREQDFIIVVVTNQAGIARGYYTEDDFNTLNAWMLEEFKKQDITISEVYYCPHHPEFGIGIYKQDSFFRKPNPGMIFKARDEFNIDLSNSIIVGDKDSDIEAGRKAGIGKLIFFKGNYHYTPPDDVFICKSLFDAIHLVSCKRKDSGCSCLTGVKPDF